MDCESNDRGITKDLEDFNLFMVGSIPDNQSKLDLLKKQIEELSETIRNIQNQTDKIIMGADKIKLNSIYFANLMSLQSHHINQYYILTESHSRTLGNIAKLKKH